VRWYIECVLRDNRSLQHVTVVHMQKGERDESFEEGAQAEGLG
jgi:hypothetical protein